MNIELRKQIDASPERVFRALTDAGELVRWFPSSAGSDPQTGGDYVLRFEFEDESENHTYAGRYEESRPTSAFAIRGTAGSARPRSSSS
jgi:uncharacterized protein YndB with AHSA1/START domain